MEHKNHYNFSLRDGFHNTLLYNNKDIVNLYFVKNKKPKIKVSWLLAEKLDRW